MANRTHYTWRKLSAAKWEDVWLDRLSEVADRLAITALAGAKTIRLETFQLTKTQAERLRKAFGGTVAVQRQNRAPNAISHVPIRIRAQLVIVAGESERRRVQRELPGRAVALIPAAMAFGTGDHATTASCLRLLADVSAERAEQPWELLDLGCGSGILAIAARLLGARRAEAADFDPAAVRTARENVHVNAVSAVVVKRLDVRTWSPRRTWPVVTANLFSDLLIETAPKIATATAPGGRLIFSGTLRAQEAEVIAAFRAAGFRIDRVVRKGKWIAGLATRLE